MIYPIRERLTQWLLSRYLKGMVFEVPDISENVKARHSILDGARGVLNNPGYKYSRDFILEMTKNKICFETKNLYDTAYNRGVIKGIQLLEERLMQLATTNATKDKPKEPERSSRNHG